MEIGEEKIGKQGIAKVHVTTTVNADIWQDAKDHGISWNDALNFGIKFLIAEKEEIEWPECRLLEKMEKIAKHRNALIIEVDALRQRVDDVDDLEDEELDEVFKTKSIKEQEVKDEN